MLSGGKECQVCYARPRLMRAAVSGNKRMPVSRPVYPR